MSRSYRFGEFLHPYADALPADGDLGAAAVEAGRVSRWPDQDFACAVLEASLYSAAARNDTRRPRQPAPARWPVFGRSSADA
jgi:hypothetical protein